MRANPTAADNNVTIVNYRGLSRSDRALRLMQSNSGAIHSSNGVTVATCALDGCSEFSRL